jgi:hypothetical protein
LKNLLLEGIVIREQQGRIRSHGNAVSESERPLSLERFPVDPRAVPATEIGCIKPLVRLALHTHVTPRRLRILDDHIAFVGPPNLEYILIDPVFASDLRTGEHDEPWAGGSDFGDDGRGGLFTAPRRLVVEGFHIQRTLRPFIQHLNH